MPYNPRTRRNSTPVRESMRRAHAVMTACEQCGERPGNVLVDFKRRICNACWLAA